MLAMHQQRACMAAQSGPSRLWQGKDKFTEGLFNDAIPCSLQVDARKAGQQVASDRRVSMTNFKRLVMAMSAEKWSESDLQECVRY